MAVEEAAAGDDPGADARPDGQEDGVGGPGRGAAPGLAGDVGAAVGFEDEGDMDLRYAVPDLLQQRILVPAGDVGRPDPAARRIGDAGNADPDGGQPAAGLRGRRGEGLDPAGDLRGRRVAPGLSMGILSRAEISPSRVNSAEAIFVPPTSIPPQ